ncbi:MAG: hypothetical protein LBB65_05510 [Burkholderiales bacterium]|nr:hypothetical protein [Burkholderiales bacterium]
MAKPKSRMSRKNQKLKEQGMGNLNENVNVPKQRHGCVTAWLVFVIIVNALVGLVYLFASGFIVKNLPGNVSGTMIVVLGLFCIINVILAVMLLRWKKIAFWGFVGTSVVALAINLSIGLGIGQSLFGLVGIAILYGVLQIQKDGVTAWKNLE